MNAGEALRAGAREIFANKFRSTLSFAAVSVGVASLLYTVAQTQGMKDALEKNLELMGPGRLTIEKKRNYTSKGLSLGLTYSDALALRRELPDLYMVEPQSTNWLRLVHGRSSLDGVRVAGATADYRRRDWVYKLRGRFLNSWDVEHRARVAVMIEPSTWFKKPFWAKFWGQDNPYDLFAKRRDLLGGIVMDRLRQRGGIERTDRQDGEEQGCGQRAKPHGHATSPVNTARAAGSGTIALWRQRGLDDTQVR